MPQLTVVALLEQTLERARSGEFGAIAIATCHADLCTGSAWSFEHATLAELVGSVAILQHRLLGQSVSEDRQ